MTTTIDVGESKRGGGDDASSRSGLLRVAIVGATGAIGSCAVQELLDNPQVGAVLVVVRRANSFQPHAKLTEFVLSSWSDAEFASICDQRDIVYCCIGTTIATAGSQEAFRRVDFDIPQALVRAAAAANVAQFHLITYVCMRMRYALPPNVVLSTVLCTCAAPRAIMKRSSFMAARTHRTRNMHT